MYSVASNTHHNKFVLQMVNELCFEMGEATFHFRDLGPSSRWTGHGIH